MRRRIWGLLNVTHGVKTTNFEPDFDYKQIEEIFLKPNYNDSYDLTFNTPKKDKILSFLCDERQFSQDRVKSALERMEAKLNEKGTQSRLDAWE